ncbi:MAG: dihydroorotate dehydrogenase (quinone) [Alphaproteobacteria bacterium]|nr:dihydroorotate dehydrogenase (quinone) [Alphaproteobacteria bacterium]
MNPLLLLPPETAHKVALWALKAGLVPPCPPDPSSLAVKILGRSFTNPIGLSAGADKEAAALQGWQRAGFGFVEAGTLMPRPRTGNPCPRLWRLAEQNAVVNWLGLPSRGPDGFIRNLKTFKENAANTMAVGVSIASAEGLPDDFRHLSALAAPYADYIALNISCPNTAEDLTSTLENLKNQVGAVRAEAGKCPVLVKLGPTDDMAFLKALVQEGLGAGATGFIATNTVPYDKRVLIKDAPAFEWPKNREGAPVGGYSGPALLPVSLAMISEIRAITGPKVPLIGVGGVQSGEDAVRLLKAGANLVQLYTGLIYKGPRLVWDIKEVLARS